MSSFINRGSSNGRGGDFDYDDEDEEQTTAAEKGEEAERLLSAYKKTRKKSASPPTLLRQGTDSDSPTSASGGGWNTEEVIVVSIEHYDEPTTSLTDFNEKSTEDDQENTIPESSSLLRDLLPHLSESNTATPNARTPSEILTKTYTEPTNLSALLKQVGNRLFSHYQNTNQNNTNNQNHNYYSTRVKRQSKISPTTSIDCRLPLSENSRDDHEIIEENLENLQSKQSAAPDENMEKANLWNETRKVVKTPLCKRCPHCRKTRILEKTNRSKSTFNNNGEEKTSCSCRICTLMESVESTNTLTSICAETTSPSSAVTIDFGSPSSVTDLRQQIMPPRHSSLSGISLELGLFCDECNAVDEEKTVIKCDSISKTFPPQKEPPQKCREQGIQVNSSSMASIATASSFGGPVCRICHSPGDKLEPLISPCRCLGTLKYVHASCLLHWLEISSRKLRRPPHCELCGYRYQRHKMMKLRRLQWPTCSRRDKIFHLLFLASVFTMIGCAAVTIVCFKADRAQPYVGSKRTEDGSAAKNKNQAGGGGSNPTTSSHIELSGQEVVTLVCGILFFCAFFVAMYVQVKAQTTVYKLLIRFWLMNQEWRVDEYKRERDVEYWRQRREQQLLQQQQQLQRRRLSGSGCFQTPLGSDNNGPHRLLSSVSHATLSLSSSSISSLRA